MSSSEQSRYEDLLQRYLQPLRRLTWSYARDHAECDDLLAIGADTLAPLVVVEKGYDHAAFPGCGSQGTYSWYPLQPNVTLHDDANYGLSFPFRGNVTGSTSSNTTVCQLVDYLGAVRSATGPFGTTTTTPDATKQYAVPR